jgi:hypothetical protein
MAFINGLREEDVIGSTVWRLPAAHRRMNSHAPLLSFDPYSDRVANASMLHEIILD